MHIAVGSTNPVKIAAVRATFERYDPIVTAVSVDPNVPTQPRSTEETIAGADSRARQAASHADLDVDQVDFGVGIESGVTEFDAVDGLYLSMWASIFDGERIERGSGPSIRLPAPIAERLDDGTELGPVVEALLGASNVGETEGTLGILTDGLTNRNLGLEAALACAAAPFVTEYY